MKNRFTLSVALAIASLTSLPLNAWDICVVEVNGVTWGITCSGGPCYAVSESGFKTRVPRFLADYYCN